MQDRVFKSEAFCTSQLICRTNRSALHTCNLEIGRRFTKLDRNKVKVESLAALGADTIIESAMLRMCIIIYA